MIRTHCASERRRPAHGLPIGATSAGQERQERQEWGVTVRYGFVIGWFAGRLGKRRQASP